ncbi:hypothetical protein D3C81_2070510 [compost metagenome]
MTCATKPRASSHCAARSLASGAADAGATMAMRAPALSAGTGAAAGWAWADGGIGFEAGTALRESTPRVAQPLRARPDRHKAPAFSSKRRRPAFVSG